MKILKRFWNDEIGFVVTTDLVLVSTILIIGIIVGLTSLRDQVIQELGDLAASVAALNQSYSFAAYTNPISGFTVAGSAFIDAADDCDTGDVNGAPPLCISVSVNSTHER